MDTDIAEGSFISRWPDWLRWILFIPAAIVGSVLAGSLYLVFVTFSGFMMGYSAEGFWWQIVSSAIIGSVFVYGGSWVAPNSQFIVSILLLILLTVISTFLFMFSFSTYSSTSPIEYGIHVFVILASGGYSLYIVKESTHGL